LFADIAATEEWLVRLTLHQGLDIYTTEGTLLDLVRGKCQKIEVK
jgi:cation channel sperm-associated protein subunit beta